MKSTRNGYGDGLVELGGKYKNVVVIDADLASSTRTIKFQKKFPDRFFNCGVAEQCMMGLAAGLATTGKICYTGSFAVFATGRAFEQVKYTIGYSNLNVKICPTHSGITVGEDGSSHQSVEDIALMRTIPTMKVIVPADYYEAREAVKAAAEIEGPVFVRLGRADAPVIYGEDYQFQFGRAVKLREGKSATICACGVMVSASLEAAEMLEREGIEVEVLNMHTIKPLDEEAILASARKTGRVVTAEEHSVIGGLGGAVAELLGERFPVPISRVGVKDKYGESGSAQELLKYFSLTSEDIALAVRSLL